MLRALSAGEWTSRLRLDSSSKHMREGEAVSVWSCLTAVDVVAP